MRLKSLTQKIEIRIDNKENKFRKWALVTGASSGIGAEFAEQLAAKGYNIIVAARRKEKLVAISTSLNKQYGVANEANGYSKVEI